MPDQIVPINNLDQVGLIKDTPSSAIPPNAFNDVRNVRFRNGSVSKMTGEVNAFPTLFNKTYAEGTNTITRNYDESIVKYICWWANPNLVPINEGYYLVIKQEERLGVNKDIAYLVRPEGTPREVGEFEADDKSAWQHTFFQGGFTLIINNGQDAPHYITDLDGNTVLNSVPVFKPLPNWESYSVTSVQGTFNAETNQETFDLGQDVNFTYQSVIVSVNGTQFTFTTGPSTATAIGNNKTAYFSDPSTIVFGGLVNGDAVSVSIESNTIKTTCGVIRAFGDFLVAGNLRESLKEDPDTIVRNLSGVVRTSDVAAPGNIPQNWNPYATGVSTADEFILSDTGVVQDLVSMQGNLFMYSNTSISTMRQTGNPNVPLAVSSITDKYGALTTNAVVEVDGKHLVIGSNDIYIFAGHPGNIQSVADGRVRDWFFDNINPLHNFRMFTIRNFQKDEVWICFPSKKSNTGTCDLALIWNYRKNNWTLRDLYGAVAGDVGPIPGGGVPAIESQLNDDTGDLGIDQIGSQEVQTIGIHPLTQVPGEDDEGTSQIWRMYISDNWPTYDASGSPTFNYVIGPDFDSGPNHGQDGVTDTTTPITFHMGFDGATGSVTETRVVMPEHLRADTIAWQDDTGYFEGQRVVYNGRIYRVRDGRTAGQLFYYPNDERQMYNQQRFHTTNDVTGGMYLDQTPTAADDPATDTQNWEDLGLADPSNSEYRDTNYVTDQIVATLRGDTTFNTYFDVVRSTADATFNIYPRAVSGDSFTGPDGQTYTMPDFTALTPSWDYTDPTLQRNNPDSSYTERYVTTLQNLQASRVMPSMNFVIGDLRYDVDVGEYVEDTVTRNHITVNVSMGGNLTDTAPTGYTGNTPWSEERLNQLIIAIRDQFNQQREKDVDDQILSNGLEPRWNTVTNGQDNRYTGFSRYIEITGSSNLPLQLRFSGVGDEEVGVIEGTDNADNRIQLDESLIFFENRRMGQYPSDAPRFVDYVYPTLTLTDPEGNDHDITLTANPRVGDAATTTADLLAGNIMTQITTFIDTLDGWSSTVPGGYTQFDAADPNRIIVAVQKTGTRGRQADASRLVSGAWDLVIKSHGSLPVLQGGTDNLGLYTNTGDAANPSAFQFLNTRTDGEYWEDPGISGTASKLTATATEDFRGAYLSRSTPTYILIKAYNGEIDLEEYENPHEIYICQVGDQGENSSDGEYNIANHTGTNGGKYTANQAVDQLIPKVREALPNVTITDTGVGSFTIVPAVYDDTSTFVLELLINDTQENADKIYEYFIDSYVNKKYYWNTKSDWYDQSLPTPFYTRVEMDDELADDIANGTYPTPGDQPEFAYADPQNPTETEVNDYYTNTNTVSRLRFATNAPVRAGTNDSQVAPDAARRPHRSNSYVEQATLDDDGTITNVRFSVDRPWSAQKINLNLQYPMFAQKRVMVDPTDPRQSVIMNKIVSADIGYTIPSWDTSPRTETEVEDTFTFTITGNDAPISYESYIRRDHLGITPEFDTERVASMAYHLEGRKKETLTGEYVYNRIGATVKGSYAAGDYKTFSSTDTQNVLWIGNDYKTDINVTGRFLNYKLSDAVNSTTTQPTGNFSQNVEWKLSGLQAIIRKGGER